MQKINGFYKDEVVRLVDFIKDGKQQGVCLSQLFEDYGKKFGRAKGSVRNFYYQLLKKQDTDQSVKDLLKDKNLYAEKIIEFTEKETAELIANILRGKAQGKSVRKTIRELSKGDDRYMLRLQNKYRNVLKSQPELIERIMLELKDELGDITFEQKVKPPVFSDFAIKRLQNEINSLYDKLNDSLKQENRTLKEKLMRLETENIRLRTLNEEISLREKNKSKIYFERDKTKHHIN